MNPVENDIYLELIVEMKLLYPGLSKLEIERICDSQFRVLRNTMSNREGKVVQMIYLGKFRPTAFNMDSPNNVKFNRKKDD